MKVRFTRPAEADLSGLVDYIAADNPNAATAVLDRILTAVERLGEFPNLGHVGRIESTLELTVARTPYVVVYRVMNAEVVILRVRHGAMRWPPEA